MSTNRPRYSRDFRDRITVNGATYSINTTNGYSNSQIFLRDRFDQMVNKVENMIKNNSIYSTWIRIQFGKNGRPITFNTATNDNEKENVIADLKVEKTGAGVTNGFTLNVIWDPFDYGQNPTEKILGLEDIIAEALNVDATTSNNSLRGYIQYGYNFTEDNELVSPKYEFFLTTAKSDTKWATGITRYTFEGKSLLSFDCDFGDLTYNAIPESENWSLMALVQWILYYYYGDPNNKPKNGSEGYGDTYPNSPGYRIDIPDELWEKCQKPIDIEQMTSSSLNPWQYCLDIMNRNANLLTTDDKESGKYDDLTKLKTYEMPYWTMYLTENGDEKTIHVAHCSPLLDGDNSTTIESNKTFTWGVLGDSKSPLNSIVTSWTTEIDLMLYLVRRTAEARRSGDNLNKAEQAYNEASSEYENIKYKASLPTTMAAAISEEEILGYENSMKEAKANLEKEQESYRKKMMEDEQYNSEITLVGIPADIPIAMEMRIKPRILEDVPSRQAGIYITVSSEDNISSRGSFTTSIKLFRIKSLEG